MKKLPVDTQIIERITNILQACADGYPQRASNDGKWLIENIPNIKLEKLTKHWWGAFDTE